MMNCFSAFYQSSLGGLLGGSAGPMWDAAQQRRQQEQVYAYRFYAGQSNQGLERPHFPPIDEKEVTKYVKTKLNEEVTLCSKHLWSKV